MDFRMGTQRNGADSQEPNGPYGATISDTPSVDKTRLFIGTYNCRTLLGDRKLLELETELRNIPWHIIGLCETQRSQEEFVGLKSGHLLYTYTHRTQKQKPKGIGFIINKEIKNRVINIKHIGPRMAEMTLWINENYKMRIIQIYAPTSNKKSADDVREFHNNLKKLTIKKEQCTIVMGDFNAVICEKGASSDGDSVVGDYVIDIQKKDRDRKVDRGKKLIEFANENKLYVMNTFFEHLGMDKWTWMHPTWLTDERDFILCNKKDIFLDVAVLAGFNTGSDHRLVRANILLDHKMGIPRVIVEIDYYKTLGGREAIKNLIEAFKRNRRISIGKAYDEAQCSSLSIVGSARIKTYAGSLTETSVSEIQPDEYFEFSAEIIELMQKRKDYLISNLDDEYKNKTNEEQKAIRAEYTNLNNRLMQKMEEEIEEYKCKQVIAALRGYAGGIRGSIQSYETTGEGEGDSVTLLNKLLQRSIANYQ